MKSNKVIALAVVMSMTVMPVLCASNYSVTTPSVQTQNYSSTTQYTQVPYSQSASQPLKGHIVMVPAGTSLAITTTSEISSSNMTLGQAVSVVLPNDFYYNNTLVAPAGSTIQGNVTAVRQGGHAGKNGQLQIRFTQINTTYGTTVPISAMIKTTDGTGILVAGTAKDTTKEYAKDMGVGAGAGAVLGLTMGALAGGSVGRGAVYGTAVGAGAGLAKSLWDKGSDVTVPAGSSLEITIDQPVTVQVAN
jgi:hypothetical protein